MTVTSTSKIAIYIYIVIDPVSESVTYILSFSLGKLSSEVCDEKWNKMKKVLKAYFDEQSASSHMSGINEIAITDDIMDLTN